MPHNFQISRDTQALFITLNTKNRLPCSGRTNSRRSFVMLLMKRANRPDFCCLPAVMILDHLHVITDQPNQFRSPSLRKELARRVIESKERNYSASLAKLQHEVRDRNYRWSIWQTEKNVYPTFSEGLFMQKVNYIPPYPPFAAVGGAGD